MGATAQKRLARRIDLEKLLLRVQPNPSPKAYLEQYTIPIDVASEILFLAAIAHDDINGRTVVDLGCGTGRLAIGAAFLGAKEVVGVDIDKSAVRLAKISARTLDLDQSISWIVGDIDVLHGNFHTVLQNPPFGVQNKRADRPFLSKALESGQVIYSVHKTSESNRTFIKRFIERHGGKVTSVFKMNLSIPRLFEFHTQKRHMVEVDIYRIEVEGVQHGTGTA